MSKKVETVYGAQFICKSCQAKGELSSFYETAEAPAFVISEVDCHQCGVKQTVALKKVGAV